MLEGFGAAERFGGEILSCRGGKGHGVVLNGVWVVGVSRASSPQPVGGKMRQNDNILAGLAKWAGGRNVEPAGAVDGLMAWKMAVLGEEQKS